MTSPAKLVYLDHSLIAREPSWPAIQQLFGDPEYQLALSIWNLLEMAIAKDLSQRAARISLIEGCKPVWILDHAHVRRQEVARFLWPRRFNMPPPEVTFMTPHLSYAQSVYVGHKVKIGLTITELVQDLGSVTDVTELKKLSTRALAVLQAVSKTDWKKRQDEVFSSVMSGIVPEKDPAGRALRKAEQQDLIAYCWHNRGEFLQACPAMAVDDALCEARIANPNRIPKDSDGIDLAHAVMAIAYCDYFIVRDNFVRACAKQSEKRLSGLKIAQVLTDPKDVK